MGSRMGEGMDPNSSSKMASADPRTAVAAVDICPRKRNICSQVLLVWLPQWRIFLVRIGLNNQLCDSLVGTSSSHY